MTKDQGMEMALDSTEREPRMMVEVRNGGGRVALEPLGDGAVVIGRGADADVRLAAETVSRRHAELAPGDGSRWRIRDLGSHNGTRLNGRPVGDAWLEPGDRIEIGEFSLTLVPETAARSPADPGPAPTATPPRDAGSVHTLAQVEPPHIALRHLSGLTELGERLLSLADPDERRRALCRFLVTDPFPARAAGVLSVVRDGEVDQPQALCPMIGRSDGEPAAHVSRTLLHAVRTSGQPSMATHTGGGAGADLAVGLSVAPGQASMSAVACPIGGDQRRLELVYAALPPEYGTGEWLALAVLGARQYQQAEMAWASRRQAEWRAAVEAELTQARQLQLALVPAGAAAPGLDAAIAFEPCRWVGGDYADILPGSDGRVLLVVADVCGKGMRAALTTSCLHTLVHTTVRAGAPLADMMRQINEHLLRTLGEGGFVTMLALELDTAGGALRGVNAGHLPGLIVGPGGAVHRLDAGRNLPLGLEPEEMIVTEARLEPDHWLVLCTDGLTELRTGERGMLGLEGLAERLAAACTAAPADARAVAGGVMERVHELRGERLAEDDYTLLVARRTNDLHV